MLNVCCLGCRTSSSGAVFVLPTFDSVVCSVQGRSLKHIPYRAPFGVWGSAVGAAMNLICLIAQFYVAVRVSSSKTQNAKIRDQLLKWSNSPSVEAPGAQQKLRTSSRHFSLRLSFSGCMVCGKYTAPPYPEIPSSTTVAGECTGA